MKSKLNSKLLVIASFMVAMLFCQCSTKTLLVDKEERVRSYLKERVLTSNKENVFLSEGESFNFILDLIIFVSIKSY